MKKFLSILIVLFSINVFAQETQPVQPRSTAVIMQELRDNIESQKELIGEKDSIIASNLAVISEMQGNVEKIAEDMERDFFMTADEALEYGIVDKVMNGRKK